MKFITCNTFLRIHNFSAPSQDTHLYFLTTFLMSWYKINMNNFSFLRYHYCHYLLLMENVEKMTPQKMTPQKMTATCANSHYFTYMICQSPKVRNVFDKLNHVKVQSNTKWSNTLEILSNSSPATLSSVSTIFMPRHMMLIYTF